MNRSIRRAISIIPALCICLTLCCSANAFAAREAGTAVERDISAYGEETTSTPDSLPQDPVPGSTPSSLPPGCPDGAKPASTIAELNALIESGTPDIYLTDDIIIGEDEIFSFTMTDPVQVHVLMGDYGIVLRDGAYLNIYSSYDPIVFSGSGVTEPLFRVGSGAELSSYFHASVYATGQNAVAVAMAGDAFVFGLTLRADGDGAVAMTVEGDAELESMEISASGADSTAIKTDGNLTLFCCEIDGEIDCKGDLTLDCTSVTHLPPNATIVERKAIWLDPVGVFDITVFGLHRLAGSEEPLPDSILLELYNKDDSYDVAAMTFTVQWEIGDAQLSVPGQYTVRAVPEPHSILGLSGIEPTEIQVHVVESGRPHLTHAKVYNFMGSSVLYIYLLEPIEDSDEIFVYHSEDGETWEKLTGDDYNDIGIWEYVDIYRADTNKTHYYVIEVIGGPRAGESSILSFYLDENGAPFPGGDRTGTDRGGAGTPEDNTGGDTPNDNGNPGDGGGNTPENSTPDNDGSPVYGGIPADNDLLNGGAENGDREDEAPLNYDVYPGDYDSPAAVYPEHTEVLGIPPIPEITFPVQAFPTDEPNEHGDVSEENALHEGDDVSSGGHANDDSESGISPLDQAENSSAEMHAQGTAAVRKPLRVHLPASVLPAGIYPETAAAQAPALRTEDAGIHAETSPPSHTNAQPPRSDSEQSAPGQEFPVDTVLIFCLGAAALCSGALLVLRTVGRGRWRHGKP